MKKPVIIIIFIILLSLSAGCIYVNPLEQAGGNNASEEQTTAIQVCQITCENNIRFLPLGVHLSGNSSTGTSKWHSKPLKVNTFFCQVNGDVYDHCCGQGCTSRPSPDRIQLSEKGSGPV